MVLDLRLELVSDQEEQVFKAANWGYTTGTKLEDYCHDVAYTKTPCAHCSLKKECGPNNYINP